ncbi:hypothetical protein BJ508DRAFT_371958 [Ascobolus immersus RN42]|uniref:F-box domain-containing protein n=1 Tax=Ascobolus immersus RN42 TaxID=1160509 RepID=A0A3N4INE1_ASCIM|nr:hypothetical protein BJ508DRAFT_371958 [Ascobolus immersus RN42]
MSTHKKSRISHTAHDVNREQQSELTAVTGIGFLDLPLGVRLMIYSLRTSTPTDAHCRPLPDLLRLPVELRLVIYRQIPTALALLQLSNTHPKFRAEIQASPSIYTNVYGYRKPTAQRFLKYAGLDSFELIHVDCLKGVEEMELLRRVLPHPKEDDELGRRSPRVVCRVCFTIWKNIEELEEPQSTGTVSWMKADSLDGGNACDLCRERRNLVPRNFECVGCNGRIWNWADRCYDGH